MELSWMEASTKVSKTAALSMDMGMAKRTEIGSVRSGRSQLFALPMEEAVRVTEGTTWLNLGQFELPAEKSNGKITSLQLQVKAASLNCCISSG